LHVVTLSGVQLVQVSATNFRASASGPQVSLGADGMLHVVASSASTGRSRALELPCAPLISMSSTPAAGSSLTGASTVVLDWSASADQIPQNTAAGIASMGWVYSQPTAQLDSYDLATNRPAGVLMFVGPFRGGVGYSRGHFLCASTRTQEQIMRRIRIVPAAALVLAACGGGNPSAVQTVGTAGGTLKAGVATLTIPAGALTQSTQVTLRETEPRHPGRDRRIEVEPRGHALAQPARLSVRLDDSNARVKMHDGNDDLVDVEVEDRNHGTYKTSMGRLGEIEVELEHGRACTTACSTGQECDDGVCKAHTEDAGKRTCDPVCAGGQECDDGTCKPHNEMEPGGAGGTATCNPACATGLECDNGVCKAHHGG